jgi:radical SAM-linked protein
MAEKFPIRLFFEKRGRAKFISHLDLYRAFQRTVKRAGLPLWETEGYNPQAWLMFTLPLSLGIEGVRESLDTELTSPPNFDSIAGRLNAVLPEGVRVLEARPQGLKHTAITSARYVIETTADTDKWLEFLDSETIFLEKKTKKKGVTTIDVKPHIKNATQQRGVITLDLPAGTDFNLNPMLIFGEFLKRCGNEKQNTLYTRTAVFAGENEFM